jgi:hypothetical protein
MPAAQGRNPSTRFTPLLLAWAAILSACASSTGPVVARARTTAVSSRGVVRGRVALVAERVPVFWSDFEVIGPTADAVFVCQRLLATELKEPTLPATVRRETPCASDLVLDGIASAWALEERGEPADGTLTAGLFVRGSYDRLERVRVTRRRLTRFASREGCENAKQQKVQAMRAAARSFLTDQLSYATTTMAEQCKEAADARSSCATAPDQREIDNACQGEESTRTCDELRGRASDARLCSVVTESLARQCRTDETLVAALKARLADLEASAPGTANLRCREGPRF